MHYVDPFRLETLETVKEHLEGEGADVLKIVTEFETVSISSSSASPKRRGGGGAIGGDDGASVGTAATARTAGTRGTASGSSHSLTDAEAAQKYITDLAKVAIYCLPAYPLPYLLFVLTPSPNRRQNSARRRWYGPPTWRRRPMSPPAAPSAGVVSTSAGVWT